MPLLRFNVPIFDFFSNQNFPAFKAPTVENIVFGTFRNKMFAWFKLRSENTHQQQISDI